MENQLRTFKLYTFFICWALCLASGSFVSVAQANNDLITFNNSYTAKLYGFSIDVNSRLSATGDGNYEMYFDADAFVGNNNEVTRVKWNPEDQTIIPLHYTFKRSGLGKGKEEALSFNWQERSVKNLTKNKVMPFDGALNVQDNLSYQLQLRQDLMAGKKKLEYAIANGKRFKHYRFEVIGEEILSTPLGNVKTVKVKRTYSNDETATYAWFAKDFQYLLVQLQQEENGSAYTIYLSKASINGKAIEHF